MLAHASSTARMSINTPMETPLANSLTFFNHLPNFFLKRFPFYGAIVKQNCCKPLLLGTKSWSMATTIICSVSRH